MILNDTATALKSALNAGTALTALLSGGTASIYGDAPVDHAAYDYVVFTHAAGGPDNQNPSNMENNVWLVQAFTVTDSARAANIAGKVDALLHKKTLAIGTRVNFVTWRETNIKLTEVDPAGVRIWRAGGYYRIRSTGT